uniref:Uncharacterized protein n=1 Tax=Kalanchoe fedtschenkoi TaxID=63787 RepID=A0A7N0TP29_KALFE
MYPVSASAKNFDEMQLQNRSKSTSIFLQIKNKIKLCPIYQQKFIPLERP